MICVDGEEIRKGASNFILERLNYATPPSTHLQPDEKIGMGISGLSRHATEVNIGRTSS